MRRISLNYFRTLYSSDPVLKLVLLYSRNPRILLVVLRTRCPVVILWGIIRLNSGNFRIFEPSEWNLIIYNESLSMIPNSNQFPGNWSSKFNLGIMDVRWKMNKRSPGSNVYQNCELPWNRSEQTYLDKSPKCIEFT